MTDDELRELYRQASEPMRCPDTGFLTIAADAAGLRAVADASKKQAQADVTADVSVESRWLRRERDAARAEAKALQAELQELSAERRARRVAHESGGDP